MNNLKEAIETLRGIAQKQIAGGATESSADHLLSEEHDLRALEPGYHRVFAEALATSEHP